MQNKIQNRLQVTGALAIGPKRETEKIMESIASIAGRSIKVERILTVKSGSTTKLTREEIMPLLLEKLKNSGPETLVITDIGDERPYKAEQIALDVKANSRAALVLLTSRTECVGGLEKFAALISDRGFNPDEILSKIDYTFQYTGVDELFPAIIELHESRLNYKNDKERLILVFEGKPNYYSGYLTELSKLNERRTHLLLARAYDVAKQIAMEGKNRFAGAILGMHNLAESFELLKILRAYNPGLPVIMQSSIPEKIQKAQNEGSVFAISKSDPLLFRRIAEIISDYFGFGNFIFRTPSGIEIGRARNIAELCDYIRKIDDASLVAHASRNDFSNWLYLHGQKKAAETIKPMFTQDAELLRSILLSDLRQFAGKKS